MASLAFRLFLFSSLVSFSRVATSRFIFFSFFSLIVCARVQQPAKRCISFPFFITLTRLLLLNILFFFVAATDAFL